MRTKRPLVLGHLTLFATPLEHRGIETDPRSRNRLGCDVQAGRRLPSFRLSTSRNHVLLNGRSQLWEGEAPVWEGEAPAEPAVRQEPHPPVPRIALGHWAAACLCLLLVAGSNRRVEAQTDTGPLPRGMNSSNEFNRTDGTPTSVRNLRDEAVQQQSDQEGPETGPSWMTKVDDWFGSYLVAPLNSVLNYDFGTQSWLGTSVPFIVIWLLCGASYFTIRMRFINLRGFWHAIRLTKGDYDDAASVGEVSHFQALSSALSATVGLGNIAGVAIGIGTGGPGASFWIMLVGLLGMSSKFTECTLGQLYRKVEPDGTVSGGPMRYLHVGLAELGWPRLGSFLAFFFTVLCIGASFGGGNAFQVGQSLNALAEQFPLLSDHPWIYGLAMALMTGLVIIGGIRSIGAVAGKIVPLMCGAYVAAALYIILANPARIGPAFWLILKSAFTPEAAYGGFFGVMVIGITRAIFSNEAGTGSAAIAHSAAKTNEPVSEGIVALLEPFIDTVVVCTMTALVIIITGVYDNPDYAQLVQTNRGAALTAAAFGIGGFAWFRWLLYAAVVLFAYSTLITWSYYGERCWTQLFGPRSSLLYKILFLGFVVLGSIVTADNVLAFSNVMLMSMALPNLLGAALLSGKVKERLDEYWRKYKSGELEGRK